MMNKTDCKITKITVKLQRAHNPILGKMSITNNYNNCMTCVKHHAMSVYTRGLFSSIGTLEAGV